MQLSIDLNDAGGVTVEGGGVRVASPRPSDGRIEMNAEANSVTARIDGAAEAPHWCWLLHHAEVTGARRLLRTGLGFSGPTSFVDLPTDGALFSYESYMITALEAADGRALVIYTTDHRRFMAKVNVFNRVHRTEFRNRRITAAPVYLEAGFATERIPMPTAGLDLPAIHFLTAATVWDGVQRAARHIAKVNQARVPDTTPRYFCSWYHKRAAFDEHDLRRVIEAAERTDAGFSTIQIDDGYQPYWGDWLEHNDKWPGGMATAAEAIRASGHAAGIWVAPMAAEKGGRIWREHPDWLLKDHDGQPILKMKAGGHAAYRHDDRYALDLSHPGVREHIADVFTTLRAWGFTAYKTDFMDWGYADSTEVQRHAPGRTSAMWFDDALRIIREAIGPDSYWLACISYFQPFVGYCDAMRVSSDVGESWNAHEAMTNDGIGGGIMNVFQESFHDQFFNNILWANDPDCIFLRTTDINLSEAEVESLALWSGILGGAVTVSDFFDDLPPHRLALWRFLKELDGGQRTARLPYWGRPDVPIHIAVRTLRDGASAALFVNPSNHSHEGAYPIAALVGRSSAPVASWSPSGIGEYRTVDAVPVRLPPHHSQLFRIAPD